MNSLVMTLKLSNFIVQFYNLKKITTPQTAALQASLSSTVSWSLLKLMSIELVMLSNHLILCRPLFLLLSIFLRKKWSSLSPL